jgi:hypothetical protein
LSLPSALDDKHVAVLLYFVAIYLAAIVFNDSFLGSVYNKFFRFGCIIICWETTDSESRVICFSYRMWCLIEMTGSGSD